MQKMPSMPSGKNRAGSAKLRKSDASVGAGTLALALLLVSLVMFTVSVRDGGEGVLGALQNVTQTITFPVRFVGAHVVAPFEGVGNIVRNLTADEQTLSDLEAENKDLAARNVELEEAQLTAERLQELLELRSTYNLQSVAASVIAGSTDTWTDSVTIDKGSAAGITVGMPVTNEYGAVGQVTAVSSMSSTVRLLSDEASSVSAMVQSSRAQGMLQGSIDKTLYLKFIRTDQTVDVGSIVVTSGLGGVFPKGLPIGKVSSVESAPGSSYYEIVVEPFSRLSNLEEVLVITSLTEDQQASAEDIESADAADIDAASGHSATTESKVPSDEEDKEAEGSEGEDATATDEGDAQSSSSADADASATDDSSEQDSSSESSSSSSSSSSDGVTQYGEKTVGTLGNAAAEQDSQSDDGQVS